MNQHHNPMARYGAALGEAEAALIIIKANTMHRHADARDDILRVIAKAEAEIRRLMIGGEHPDAT